MLKSNIQTYNIKECIKFIQSLLDTCIKQCQTKSMKNVIKKIKKGWKSIKNSDKFNDNITKYDIKFLNGNKLLTFQIKSIEAVPFVLYCFGRWFRNPSNCIINCVTLGGDADTTGNMLAGLIGALYGTKWIPIKWFNNLENYWDNNTKYKN